MISSLTKNRERLTTELLTPNRENSCKGSNKDVIRTGNKNRQEEIPGKPGMSKDNKSPLKKKIYLE